MKNTMSIEKGSKLTMVSRTEVAVAKDGRSYYTATLSPGFGQLHVKRNFWQQYVRDAKTQLPTKELYWERGTPAQADALIASGVEFDGAKVTKTVQKYTLGSGDTAREVNTYSTAVFPGEDIVAVFANANHNIIDEETGEVLGVKVPTLASNKKEEKKAEVAA